MKKKKTNTKDKMNHWNLYWVYFVNGLQNWDQIKWLNMKHVKNFESKKDKTVARSDYPFAEYYWFFGCLKSLIPVKIHIYILSTFYPIAQPTHVWPKSVYFVKPTPPQLMLFIIFLESFISNFSAHSLLL